MNTKRTTAWIVLPLFCSLFLSVGCAPARFENEYVAPHMLRSSPAAIPRGMRRTKDGWEDASLWSLPSDFQTGSLDDWIEREREQEPGWVRRGIDEVRETPPWMVAAIQISAIAAIVHISRRQQAEQSA